MIERVALRKVDSFVAGYPHKLGSNEWKAKFPMTIDGRKTTYNPDFYCLHIGYFIEVATSFNNISCQGPKWEEALRLGYKLKVFWWEGDDITEQFIDNGIIAQRRYDPRN